MSSLVDGPLFTCGQFSNCNCNCNCNYSQKQFGEENEKSGGGEGPPLFAELVSNTS